MYLILVITGFKSLQTLVILLHTGEQKVRVTDSSTGQLALLLTLQEMCMYLNIHNNRIQKFTSDGTFITKLGTEGSGNGQFRYPWGIAVDSSGRVYVADDHNFRMQVFLWKPILVANPVEPPIAGFK